MFARLRDSWLTTGLWAFMALYFFNISIDAQEPLSFRENLSVNEQESIVEFIAEVVLGFTTAFLEVKDPEDESTMQFNKKQLFLFHASRKVVLHEVAVYASSKQWGLHLNHPILPGHTSIDAPPPQG